MRLKIPGWGKITGIVLAHIVLWFLFLSLPTLFNPRRQNLDLPGFIDDLLEPPRWRNGLLLILVFYFNYYVAIPRFYLTKRRILLILSFCLCFGCFFLLNYSMRPPLAMPPPPGFPPHDAHMHPFGPFSALGNSFNLFMFIIVYILSFAIALYQQWQMEREEKLSAEISFLQAQMNPHFLFNILNSIYSLALMKSDDTPDAIVKLSGLMRYSVSDARQDLVTLEKEISYIKNYIELQQMRLGDKVKISLEINGLTTGYKIGPFLLIPFVENAFRYGVNSEDNSDIRIVIHINNGDLNLNVRNNKVYIRAEKDNNTGLGIGTTRKRLQLLYPDRHTINIKDGIYDFDVSLQIKL